LQHVSDAEEGFESPAGLRAAVARALRIDTRRSRCPWISNTEARTARIRAQCMRRRPASRTAEPRRGKECGVQSRYRGTLLEQGYRGCGELGRDDARVGTAQFIDALGLLVRGKSSPSFTMNHSPTIGSAMGSAGAISTSGVGPHGCRPAIRVGQPEPGQIQCDHPTVRDQPLREQAPIEVRAAETMYQHERRAVRGPPKST
jgi:hypothetical protein